MLKPLIPVVSDWYAHEFNEIEHITKVHALYGNNHLEKELTTNNSDKQGKSSTTLKLVQVTFHIYSESCDQPLLTTLAGTQFLFFQYKKPPFVLISTLAPPPKFS